MSFSLSYSSQDFSDYFEKSPFHLKHNLVGNDLFTWENLMRLAKELPNKNIEFNAGDVPSNLLEGKKPGHNYSAIEVIESIRSCKTWLGLKKIEQIPRYRDLVCALLDSVKASVDRKYPHMYGFEGFIFITSPGSTVPFHMDPEHNFLLQIAGEKTMMTFDKFDREIVSDKDIEAHYDYSREHRRMTLNSEHESRGKPFVLAPGDALHVPINMPHYVKNSDQISISLSVTYRTPASDRRENVIHVNRKLRRLGLKPTSFEDGGMKNYFKNLLFNVYSSSRKGSSTAK